MKVLRSIEATIGRALEVSSEQARALRSIEATIGRALEVSSEQARALRSVGATEVERKVDKNRKKPHLLSESFRLTCCCRDAAFKSELLCTPDIITRFYETQTTPSEKTTHCVLKKIRQSLGGKELIIRNLNYIEI